MPSCHDDLAAQCSVLKLKLTHLLGGISLILVKYWMKQFLFLTGKSESLDVVLTYSPPPAWEAVLLANVRLLPS